MVSRDVAPVDARVRAAFVVTFLLGDHLIIRTIEIKAGLSSLRCSEVFHIIFSFRGIE